MTNTTPARQAGLPDAETILRVLRNAHGEAQYMSTHCDTDEGQEGAMHEALALYAAIEIVKASVTTPLPPADPDTCAACGGFANGTLGTNNVPICSGCIRGAYADLMAQVAAAEPDIDVVFPPGHPGIWMTAEPPLDGTVICKPTAALPPDMEQRVQELHDYYSSRPVGSEGGSYHGNGAADVLWLIQALRAAVGQGQRTPERPTRNHCAEICRERVADCLYCSGSGVLRGKDCHYCAPYRDAMRADGVDSGPILPPGE